MFTGIGFISHWKSVHGGANPRRTVWKALVIPRPHLNLSKDHWKPHRSRKFRVGTWLCTSDRNHPLCWCPPVFLLRIPLTAAEDQSFIASSNWVFSCCYHSQTKGSHTQMNLILNFARLCLSLRKAQTLCVAGRRTTDSFMHCPWHPALVSGPAVSLLVLSSHST